MINKGISLPIVACNICLFLFSLQSVAQEIAKPSFSLNGIPISRQILCLGGEDSIREAIAEANILFASGTEFVLELSDENGVFSDQVTRELSRFTTSVAIPPGGLIEFPSFPIPKDVRGEDYSLRVTVPARGTLSAIRNDISIYYFDSSEIAVQGPNNEETIVVLCDNESTTLTAIPEDIPVKEWLFNGMIIPGETSNILENVTESGSYQAVFDLGSCTDIFNFNIKGIEVVNFKSGQAFIEQSSPQEFCPSDVKVLSTNINYPEFTYQWYKNGVLISEYDGHSVNLPISNFSDIYTVTITSPKGCSITTDPVEVINLGSDILTQPPLQVMLLPTQTSLTLSITTNAPTSGSTVEWFRNGISFQGVLPITDPGALSIDVTNPGVYSASLFANDVCMDTLEAITEVFEPVGFRTEISTILDCDATTSTLGLETLYGVTSTGTEVPILEEQYPLFDFEWFLGTQSTGVTETTLSVGSDNLGETYALEATLRDSGMDTARSNELTVEFLGDTVVIDSDPGFLSFGSTVTLSVAQSSNYTYDWFLVVDGDNELAVDGETIVSGQGSHSIVVDTRGVYFVRITLQDCIVDSQPITVSEEAGNSEIVPNVVTPNNDGINDNWLLPASLFNQQDVEVTIYSSRGQVDFVSSSYQNNWPAENSKSSGQDPIYYYIITKNSSIIKKGAITIMR
ncbi:T9SS type B sorting domain-containing protein [Aquimarina sediminis]|uniref:T9SS type B sorting domain-containing protein n=1 Tax=Aquimarina sediminis TaxID=2070536 RepID=UPI000CA010F4|nr:gliding motility-associated C-terminal domain-containing protein [Aquimarina sediminis]